MSRWWILMLGTLVACPGSSPQPDDDDDSAHDDDDSAPLGIDLTDGGEVVLRFAQIVELRFLIHTNEFGLLAADTDCPVVGDDVWTGGCITAGGYRFEGSLTASDLPGGGTHYVGAGWSVQGEGGPFARIRLDGTADVATTPTSTSYLLEGTMEAVSQPAVAALRDWTVTGTYSFEGVWPEDDGPQPHSFAGALTDPDGAAWEADFTLLVVDGPCSTYDEGTYVLLSSAGVTAELDFLGDLDPCDYCWPWSVNGEPQPAPACLSL